MNKYWCLILVFYLIPIRAFCECVYIDISTDQPVYSIGDTMNATVTISNSGPPVNADIYIAAQLPDNTLLFYPDFTGSSHPAVSCINIPKGPFVTDYQILAYAFPPGSEGGYRWYGVITPCGADPYNAHNWLGFDKKEFSVISPGAETWTVMVYLCGDNDLESAAIDDFNEMEQGLYNSLSPYSINVIVLFDRIPGYDYTNGNWTNTRLYQILPDNDPNIINSQLILDLEEMDMGDPAVLEAFINYSLSHYPADYYAVILWNHGDGWRMTEALKDKAVCWDYTNGSDFLSMDEVETALAGTGEIMDLIGFDACLMEMIEVAYETKNYSKAVVGSEETELDDGWSYIPITQWRANYPGMDPNNLGSLIVNTYGDAYPSYLYPKLTQSACDTAFLNDLANAVNNFANAMINQTGYWSQIQGAREDAEHFSNPDYIDLYHFAQLVKTYVFDFIIQDAAQAVMDALSSTVIAEHHASAHPNAHGLSIYFPRYQYDINYDNINFSLDTNWDDFLRVYLNGYNLG
jgi:hypothetical protein